MRNINPARLECANQHAGAEVVEAAHRIGGFLRCAEKFIKLLRFLCGILIGDIPLRMRNETAFFESFEETERTFFRRERIDCADSEKRESAASFLVEITYNARHVPRILESEQIPFDAVRHADEKQNRNSALFQLAVGVEIRYSGVRVENDSRGLPRNGGRYDPFLSGRIARERNDGGQIVCRARGETECFEAFRKKDDIVAEEDEFFCDDF